MREERGGESGGERDREGDRQRGGERQKVGERHRMKRGRETEWRGE